MKKPQVIPNQVFVGLPWKNVRPRYEACIQELEKRFPLHFSIVGRDAAQDADDLLEVIKQRIDSSSYGIFDATNGNANVSLEYGYAEARELPRAIYLSTHKSSRKSSAGIIISDLGGKRRVEYTNEQSLRKQLETFCRNHDYSKRFENFLRKKTPSSASGAKKRFRTLSIKALRFFDGKSVARREDLVQHLQALSYSTAEIETALKRLHEQNLISIAKGRYSQVTVA